jgi:hypothetical protein
LTFVIAWFYLFVCALQLDYRADTTLGYERIVWVNQYDFMLRDILVTPFNMDDLPDLHARVTKLPEFLELFLPKTCLYLP